MVKDNILKKEGRKFKEYGLTINKNEKKYI